MKRIALVVMILSLTVAVGSNAGTTAILKGKNMNETKSAKTWTEPKASTVDANKKYIAVITTSKGKITAELFSKEAPLSVTNFKYLADGKFYNGLTFHRVVPGFVVQGGDPTATGSGGPGYTISAEIKLPHKRGGTIAWARTGDAVNPERRSSGSQFYITYDATPQLDNQYTVFGQVVGGMDVVNKIQKGDIIESIVVKTE